MSKELSKRMYFEKYDDTNWNRLHPQEFGWWFCWQSLDYKGRPDSKIFMDFIDNGIDFHWLFQLEDIENEWK